MYVNVALNEKKPRVACNPTEGTPFCLQLLYKSSWEQNWARSSLHTYLFAVT